MKKRIIILIVICALIFVDKVNADTINVCKEGCTYSSIKTAYDNSKSGDTILIKSGTYEEDFINLKKEINFVGDTDNEVIIKSKGKDGIFYIDGIKDKITFSNLVISSVNPEENSYTILINEAENIIFDNIKINDSKDGITIFSSNVKINNLVAINTTSNVIYAEKSQLEIKDTRIDTSNRGIVVSSLSNLKIDNLIASNVQKSVIYVENSLVEINKVEINDLKDNFDNENKHSLINLNNEVEGKITDIVVDNAKYGVINIKNSTKLININGLVASDCLNGLYIENANVLLEDIYILNSINYSIKTINNAKLSLKNINGFKLEDNSYLRYSLNKECDSYVEESEYVNDNDVILYSCIEKNISNENSEKNDAKVENNNNENIENPKTGEFNIIIIVLLALITIGCSIWYFKKVKRSEM